MKVQSIAVQKESEKSFNGFLASVRYIDDENNVVPLVLTDDESSDPEGDRDGGEEKVESRLTS